MNGLKDLSVSATSEAEMRALFIWLTANYDGGMEVIIYAGRLSVDRPDDLKSGPIKVRNGTVSYGNIQGEFMKSILILYPNGFNSFRRI
jgi:hypothetical protein